VARWCVQRGQPDDGVGAAEIVGPSARRYGRPRRDAGVRHPSRLPRGKQTLRIYAERLRKTGKTIAIISYLRKVEEFIAPDLPVSLCDEGARPATTH
jgi:hypothetical protein